MTRKHHLLLQTSAKKFSTTMSKLISPPYKLDPHLRISNHYKKNNEIRGALWHSGFSFIRRYYLTEREVLQAKSIWGIK